MSEKLLFNGKKIEEARELSDRTQITLAEEIGVSRQTLRMFESGERVPRPDTLHKLANVLGVRWDYFMLPSREPAVNPTYFRSFAAASKRARTSASRRLECLEDLIDALYSTGLLEAPNLPDFNEEYPLKHSESDIERIAVEARKHFGLSLGPIKNLVSLLEQHNVVIATAEFHDRALDAFSRWSDKNPLAFVYLCSDKQCAVRSRFDLAHELGHLILHRKATNFSDPKLFKLYEQQADYFAGAFLLPAQSFLAELPKPKIEYFEVLKGRWQVSIASMIMRSRQLEIIREQDEKNLWITYSRKGMRGNEPLDHGPGAIPMEKPSLIKKAIRIAIDENLITRARLLELLPYKPERLDRMFGLDGVLNPDANFDEGIEPTNTLPPNVITSVAA